MSLNINKATVQDVQTLGLNPEWAKYVIDYREYLKANAPSSAGFKSAEDFKQLNLPANYLQILISNTAFGENGTAAKTSNDKNVVFSSEETDVSKIIKEKITGYVDKLFIQYSTIISKYQDAIQNFETTMELYDKQDALGYDSIIDILEQGISMLIASDTPAGIIYTFSKLLIKSLKRDIDKAEESNDRRTKNQMIGDWIKQQRYILDAYRNNFSKEDLIEELNNLFLEAPDKMTFSDQLFQAETNIRSFKILTVEIEKQLYEKWIVANGNGSMDIDAPGCLELEFNLDEEEKMSLVNNGVIIKANGGEKLQIALNHILSLRLPYFQYPINLKVRKRIIFHTPGIAGGTARYWGWLDEDNNITAYPNQTDLVQKAMGWSSWHSFYKKFQV